MTTVISFIASIALAQQVVVTRVAVNAGSATDVTGVTSSAASVIPSVWITASPNFAISLAGSGTTFRGGAWSAGAAGGVIARRPLGPFAIVLDGRSAITATSYHHTFLTGDLSPSLEFRAGALTFFGGGRLSRALVWSPDPHAEGIPGFPMRLSDADRLVTRRSGRSLSYGAQLKINALRRIPAVASYREERGLHFQAYSAAASLAVSPILAIEIATGKHSANRMTGSAAGRFINAGASFRLNVAETRMPQPIGIAGPRKGETRMAITARDAERVEVAGDFTSWRMKLARRASNGVWYVDLAIPPGQYRYAFRIDGKEWRVPAGAQVAEDEFGGKTAWLTVRDSAAGAQAEHKEEK